VRIDDYRFGRITVDAKVYSSDVLIWPEGVDASWWRKEGHRLSREDLAELLEKDPDVLIIGQGAHGLMRVPRETMDFLCERCGEVYAANTQEACDMFNEMSAGDRRVAAALHLTC